MLKLFRKEIEYFNGGLFDHVYYYGAECWLT